MKHLTLVTSALAAIGLGIPASTAPAASDLPGAVEARSRSLTPADALEVATGEGGARQLRTRDGRTAFLRGANVNALVDHGGSRRLVPVAAEDGLQARALGFSVVRLAVSWSRIAPAPGQFDARYLDEIRRTAAVFADQGIYVLLDMHQDRYGATLGPSGDESDGAPAWASRTDGASTAAGSSGGHPYYGTAAARTAAKHFFRNTTVAGRPLQDHYADAVEQVARVGRELGPAFAGIELYNEPIDPESLLSGLIDTFSPTRLWPFYRRVIARLRGAGHVAPIWFEPQATRTQTDNDAVASRFSPDPGLVYGPHVYTDVFNGRNGALTPARIALSFTRADREARAYGAALAPTELPGASGGAWETHRAAVLGQLDRLGAGGMVWVWKQHPDSDYGWGVLRADGGVRGDSGIAKDYGRSRVQASGPRVLSQAWKGGVLTVRTRGAGVVDLWDGAAFRSAPTGVGASPALTVDGVAPAAQVVATRQARSPLATPTTWVEGRQLRVTVGAGDHTLRLAP